MIFIFEIRFTQMNSHISCPMWRRTPSLPILALRLLEISGRGFSLCDWGLVSTLSLCKEARMLLLQWCLVCELTTSPQETLVGVDFTQSV